MITSGSASMKPRSACNKASAGAKPLDVSKERYLPDDQRVRAKDSAQGRASGNRMTPKTSPKVRAATVSLCSKCNFGRVPHRQTITFEMVRQLLSAVDACAKALRKFKPRHNRTCP